MAGISPVLEIFSICAMLKTVERAVSKRLESYAVCNNNDAAKRHHAGNTRFICNCSTDAITSARPSPADVIVIFEVVIADAKHVCTRSASVRALECGEE